MVFRKDVNINTSQIMTLNMSSDIFNVPSLLSDINLKYQTSFVV